MAAKKNDHAKQVVQEVLHNKVRRLFSKAVRELEMENPERKPYPDEVVAAIKVIGDHGYSTRGLALNMDSNSEPMREYRAKEVALADKREEAYDLVALAVWNGDDQIVDVDGIASQIEEMFAAK